MTYHHFGKKPRVRRVHPYQLRQSGNRWYVVGYEQRLASRLPLVVLPIDRIDDVVAVQGARLKVNDLDIDDYFYDIVGVSLNPESKAERIRLRVGYPDAEYMLSKPLHGSQHLIERSDEGMTFEMKVIPNEEFVQQLLAYAHNTEILEPVSLRERLCKRAKEILAHNEIKGDTPLNPNLSFSLAQRKELKETST